ncbi:MAG: hypothetical protein ABI741_06785 [Ferruginibacter sp.]
MIHLRYDWRRPVFWATLCLTFFLSSQNNDSQKNMVRSIELLNKTGEAGPVFAKGNENNIAEGDLLFYFYPGK